MSGKGDSVRERAISRLKVLAGTTAATVVVACGYGVVDPLPSPTCFQSPRATATGKFVPAPAGQEAEDVRFMLITISFSQTDGSTLGNATAKESSGPSLSVVSQSAGTGSYDFLVRLPKRVLSFSAQLSSACPETSGRMNLSVNIDTTDAIDVQVLTY